jgi:hypothetical protein
VLLVGAGTIQLSVLVLNRLILRAGSKMYLSLFCHRLVVQFLTQQISQTLINNHLSLTFITWERIILDEAGKCGKNMDWVWRARVRGRCLTNALCHQWDGNMCYYYLTSLIRVSTFTMSSSGRYIRGINVQKILSIMYVQGDQNFSVHLMQNSVYSNNPHTTDDLKVTITEHIRNADRAILNTVFENSSACQ